MIQKKTNRKEIVILFLIQIARYARCGEHMVRTVNDYVIKKSIRNCCIDYNFTSNINNRIKRCVQQLLK